MAEGGWQTYHVLFAKADSGTGAVTCQLGDVVTGEVAEPSAIMFAGGFGDISLPAPPLTGVAAAEVIALDTTWGKVIVGARSVRSAAIASLVKMGEKALYADGSQAVALFKLDGSINLLTTHDNSATGRNVNSFVNPTEGFGWEWPWSRLNSRKDGLHYSHVSGASFDLGQINLTGPFAALASAVGGTVTAATLSAKLIRLEGTVISIGSASGVPDYVAKSTPLLAALDAVMAVLSRIATPAAFTTVSGGPATAIPDVVTLITAAQTAVTQAHAAMPSTSTTVT